MSSQSIPHLEWSLEIHPLTGMVFSDLRFFEGLSRNIKMENFSGTPNEREATTIHGDARSCGASPPAKRDRNGKGPPFSFSDKPTNAPRSFNQTGEHHFCLSRRESEINGRRREGRRLEYQPEPQQRENPWPERLAARHYRGVSNGQGPDRPPSTRHSPWFRPAHRRSTNTSPPPPSPICRATHP